MYVKPRDVRLRRDLSIQEFIEAFTIYKNVICETSNRSKEFDLYLYLSKYKGNVFYQYHKAFAMKVTTIKLTRGLTVDWFIRDERLYATVCSGYPINVCAHCVGSYICQICALNMLNQRCVRIMLIIQRVIDTFLVLTLTKAKASTQLIHMEDLNYYIRDARFVTIFLQDHPLEVIAGTHM